VALLSSSIELFGQIRYQQLNFKATAAALMETTVLELLKRINPTNQLTVSCNFRKGSAGPLSWKLEWEQFFEKEFPVNAFSLSVPPRRLDLYSYDEFNPTIHLSQLQELSFCHCSVSDVNCLFQLRKLSLEYCNGIVDLSRLGDIPLLLLNSCQGIQDISALQNNRTLSIYRCSNISTLTVNFLNVVNLSTDLSLTYSATTTLKNIHSLELSLYTNFDIFLSSSVVSVILKNLKSVPLSISLSSFSQSLKSVKLVGLSSRMDLTPFGDVEILYIECCSDLINANGLGKNNKTVTINYCENVTDLSALKTVARVIILGVRDFPTVENSIRSTV
jgi:hypothetical protein